MGQRPTRRRFIETVGAAGVTVAAAGCTALTEEPSSNPTNTQQTASPTEAGWPENGAVVFVYDDGPVEDYTKAFPVHQEFDAPATTGIVTNWIGRKGSMKRSQIEELSKAGWEIASHTVKHTTLDQAKLVQKANSDDTRIYPEHIRHGHHEQAPLEITDGNQTVQRPIEGLGRDGDDTRYIELGEPVGKTFAAQETVVRYPSQFVERSLGKSKRDLEELGFTVDSLIAPYDKFDDYSMQFVPNHYNYVANANPGSRINRPGSFDPYQTRRDYYIEYTSPVQVELDLGTIADTGALGVFGAHAASDEVTQKKIRKTLELIEEKNIEVMTLREAGKRFQNAEPKQSGQTNQTNRTTTSTTQ